jgi:hypothetical protein
MKRGLSIFGTFSHKTAEGQRELTGSRSQTGGEIDRQRKDYRGRRPEESGVLDTWSPNP